MISTLSALNVSKLQISKATSLKEVPETSTLKFGHTFTDHMLLCPWNEATGWAAPQIVPFGTIPLAPQVSSLHYALQCFEGMKGYVDQNDHIRLFRPTMNTARLNRSAERLCLPAIDSDQFLLCLNELLKLEKRWIPSAPECSLYIRPTLISTEPTLGVGVPTSALLYVILCPVGAYYPEGFKPVKLLAQEQGVRAWPGGTGHFKIGGNYASTIKWQRHAASQGYSQVLWLHGEENLISEVGTMNFFVFWHNAETGKRELVTAPLDGIVLPGVTRDSIMQLTRQWGEFDVIERYVTMPELIKAVDDKRLIEAFGSGTAAVVAPISDIKFRDRVLHVPLNPLDPAAGAGPLTKRVKDVLTGIQTGRVPHEWSVLVD